MSESRLRMLEKKEVKAWLKEMIPDDVLLLRFYGEDVEYLCSFINEEKRTAALYNEIAVFSGMMTYNFDFEHFSQKHQWRSPREIAIGLKLYEHSADFLRWLIDRFTEDSFAEAVVLVQQEIERRGLHMDNVKGRFEL